MFIESLSLKNFRNYQDALIVFSKNLNIIYGQNAQGKTNIIEAIFLCASGRSHRTSKDAELLNVNAQSFIVSLEFQKDEGKKSIDMSYERAKKKVIMINEIPITRMGSLMGNLLAVIFSPEDILIIKEGPSQRRRFIDITISQLKPSYFYDLQQYNRILLQRNTLLKEIPKKRNLIDTLEIWDEKLSEIASRIMKVRNEFIKRLSDISKKNHLKLTDNNEQLEIKYTPSIDTKNLFDVNKLREEIFSELNIKRSIELKRGITLVGPHRDDYEMILNGMNLKMFGSQGQQRTVILSLKLAEIEIIREEVGESPVLLLDDVMSELDHKRREFLIENIEDIQTFITCTEKDFFENKNYGNTLFIKINEGKVSNDL